MEYCENYEDCRNKESSKCINCECNKNNFEEIKKYENTNEIYKKNPKRFYRFVNNYNPQ